MKTPRTLKRIVAGALLSSGVAVAGLGLGAGSAQATPGLAPLAHWCPGDPVQQLPTGWNPECLPRLLLDGAGRGTSLFTSCRGSGASADVRPRPVRVVSLACRDFRVVPAHGQ